MKVSLLAELMAVRKYPFVVQRDDSGYYIRVPDLKGCGTSISSIEELEENVYDAKLSWIQACLDKGLEVPDVSDMDGIEKRKRELYNINIYENGKVVNSINGLTSVQMADIRSCLMRECVCFRIVDSE